MIAIAFQIKPEKGTNMIPVANASMLVARDSERMDPHEKGLTVLFES